MTEQISKFPPRQELENSAREYMATIETRDKIKQHSTYQRWKMLSDIIIGNANVPEAYLLDLCESKSDEVAELVAQSKSATPKVLDKLLGNRDYYKMGGRREQTLEYVMANPNLPAEKLQSIFHKYFEYEKKKNSEKTGSGVRIANPTLNRELNHTMLTVYGGICINPNTPSEILFMIAHESEHSYFFFRKIIKHPNCTEKILDALVDRLVNDFHRLHDNGKGKKGYENNAYDIARNHLLECLKDVASSPKTTSKIQLKVDKLYKEL